jgi:hypothetical protein
MSTEALTVQLLSWVAETPRTYDETMQAWRTTCPRLTIWEDAVRDGLLVIDDGHSMKGARVLLSDSGRALLQAGLARNAESQPRRDECANRPPL